MMKLQCGDTARQVGDVCIPHPTHTAMSNDHLLNNRLPQTINKGVDTCVVYRCRVTKFITDIQEYRIGLRLRVNVFFERNSFIIILGKINRLIFLDSPV